jgi:hypothetical protein
MEASIARTRCVAAVIGSSPAIIEVLRCNTNRKFALSPAEINGNGSNEEIRWQNSCEVVASAD